MSTPNRWAIRDAGIATFYSLVTGKPVTTLKTLKTSGLDVSGDVSYATGGLGNSRIVGFSSNRATKITLQDAIFDNKALAMLTGNEITEGATAINIIESPKVTTNTATLVKTPVGALYGVYKLNADGTLGAELTKAASTPTTGQYSITGKVLTFFAGDIPNGSSVTAYFGVTTDATAKKIKVTSDAFGGTFKVVLDCIVRDVLTKADYAAQITIPNAQFENNFNLSLSVDGDPAVLDLNMEALKDPVSTDLWTMVIYDQGMLT